ncbi:MAG: 3-methyl-2-oxobutanoate hydroxymethyltransferase [Isosphaera sp.]|nr:3-methyl-2-oxobutanoate hydroxymethyltransferase [Isosphaera sp.]
MSIGGTSGRAPGAEGGGRVTVAGLHRMTRRGDRFACLTCYDATCARWLARAGVHVLLVGDTAAEMVLGHARTIDMPLEVLLALTAGVRRGAERAGAGSVVPLIMGDMPFMSYHLSEDAAVSNAARFMLEGRADVVKLEVDAAHAGLVRRLTRAGVPVCAHVGSRPQRAALSGGYSAAGRTEAEAEAVVGAARAMLDAGAVMLLVEAVPDGVAERVVGAAEAAGGVPVIGIGAGPSPRGQVLVMHDVLGLTDRAPAFAEPLAALGPLMEGAARQWVQAVVLGNVKASPYTAKAPEAS